ncbi:MAG: hypothetical protein HZB53_03990 [Chloroflexi bacterium]|nr:hypothetical protein [Chloroflexota bacterium]
MLRRRIVTIYSITSTALVWIAFAAQSYAGWAGLGAPHEQFACCMRLFTCVSWTIQQAMNVGYNSDALIASVVDQVTLSEFPRVRYFFWAANILLSSIFFGSAVSFFFMAMVFPWALFADLSPLIVARFFEIIVAMGFASATPMFAHLVVVYLRLRGKLHPF